MGHPCLMQDAESNDFKFYLVAAYATGDYTL
jgi:hypothetical protein